jgi:transposase
VRGIFQHSLTLEDVAVVIDRLLSRLARSRPQPFVRLGQTIRKHRDGILAAIRLGSPRDEPRPSTTRSG